jgi:NAD-dependent DNA ligase
MDPHKYTKHIDMDELKGSFSITWSFDLPRDKIAELFQQQGYIFHEQPLKTTDFILIGDKAGSKKAKAQELWITIYEWWGDIINKFPFVKNVSNETNKPKIQGLF